MERKGDWFWCWGRYEGGTDQFWQFGLRWRSHGAVHGQVDFRYGQGKSVLICDTGFLADIVAAIELDTQRAFGFDFRQFGSHGKRVEFAK